MTVAIENLFLMIIEGQQKGEEMQIREGLRIGRSHGEWIIKDPRVSALHAEIVLHPKGFYLLKDLGSRHQIRYKGTPVLKVALLPGVSFQLGSTIFLVVKRNFELEPEPTQAEPLVKTAQDDILFNIKQFLSGLPPQSTAVTVQMFLHPIQVQWIGGLEYGRTEWITFGPRSFGDWGCDFVLHERVCPPKAFTVHWPPEDPYPYVTTDHPKLVLIDDESIKRKPIVASVTMKIGVTRIKLSVKRDAHDNR